MSKDLKPKQRLGQTKATRVKSIIGWALFVAIAGGGAWAAYNYAGKTTVEVPVARVRNGEFILAVRARGELRSTKSIVIAAPQVPNLQIVKLAESGRPIRKGQVVVEFDSASQEQTLLERQTSVKTVDSQIIQTKASHRMTNEADEMSLMQTQYNVERAKLEASKAEVVSAIQGAKAAIDVGIREGELGQVKTSINSHQVSQKADLTRQQQSKDQAIRNLERTQSYMSQMVLYAPADGILNVLPNFRTQGNFGSTPPPFKEGDSAFTGAQIAEIPDLSSMRIELKLDEVDRGKLQIGQRVRVRVDALPEKDLEAVLEWISPIAQVVGGRGGRGGGGGGGASGEKSFPAFATLKEVDDRLRPGMSATAEILLENQPQVLMIPLRANFTSEGKPAVYIQQGDQFVLRQIEIGKRNDSDMVVVSGLQEGDQVALENPVEAARRAKRF